MPFLEWFPGSSWAVPGGLPRGVSRWLPNSAQVISRRVPGQFLRWVLEGLLWWFLGGFRAAPGMGSWLGSQVVPAGGFPGRSLGGSWAVLGRFLGWVSGWFLGRSQRGFPGSSQQEVPGQIPERVPRRF